jgi:predicted MPP superfamily phosphohydrolase
MASRRLTRRDLLEMAASFVVGTGTVSLGSLAYARGVEPEWVDVHPVRLTLPRLAPEFDGYRVAQISDLHMGDWMDRNRLTDVVDRVNRRQPDLIAVTGDFVTVAAEREADGLVEALRELRARDGVVAILGNHDHWSSAAVIRQVIHDSGMIELSNAIYTLERGRALLHIAGIDDVWERRERLDLVMRRLPAEGAAILLAHEPDFADLSAAQGRFDLQISGHSHGGQVVLPGYGPLKLPRYGRKYPLGLYQVGEMLQYTNRGIGMLRPHVRFNCRPEITVFTLAARQW